MDAELLPPPEESQPDYDPKMALTSRWEQQDAARKWFTSRGCNYYAAEEVIAFPNTGRGFDGKANRVYLLKHYPDLVQEVHADGQRRAGITLDTALKLYWSGDYDVSLDVDLQDLRNFQVLDDVAANRFKEEAIAETWKSRRDDFRVKMLMHAQSAWETYLVTRISNKKLDEMFLEARQSDDEQEIVELDEKDTESAYIDMDKLFDFWFADDTADEDDEQAHLTIASRLPHVARSAYNRAKWSFWRDVLARRFHDGLEAKFADDPRALHHLRFLSEGTLFALADEIAEHYGHSRYGYEPEPDQTWFGLWYFGTKVNYFASYRANQPQEINGKKYMLWMDEDAIEKLIDAVTPEALEKAARPGREQLKLRLQYREDTPREIVNWLLEAEEHDIDPEAIRHAVVHGNDSLIEVFQDERLRIVIPLTFDTARKYVGDREWFTQNRGDFESMAVEGPIFIGIPTDEKNVFALQFKKYHRENYVVVDGYRATLTELIHNKEYGASLVNGLVNWFTKEISRLQKRRGGDKTDLLQHISALIALGAADTAWTFMASLRGRGQLEKQLGFRDALQLGLAGLKRGNLRVRSLQRMLGDQPNALFGRNGFYLLFDDWQDTVDFFGKDRDGDYKTVAEQVFGGDASELFNTDYRQDISDLWDKVNDENKKRIFAIMSKSTIGNPGEDDYIQFTPQMLQAASDDEIVGWIKTYFEDDIGDAIQFAGQTGDERGMESTYYNKLTGALDDLFGSKSQWVKGPDGKHRLGWLIAYDDLSDWLQKYDDQTGEEYGGGDVLELAAGALDKLTPDLNNVYGDFDEAVFNEDLDSRLYDIEKTTK